MATRKRIRSEETCDKLDACFNKTVLYDDKGRKFGRLEGWEAGSLPLSESCLDELEKVRETPTVTVITMNKKKGRYVLHCPHPPCWKSL